VTDLKKHTFAKYDLHIEEYPAEYYRVSLLRFGRSRTQIPLRRPSQIKIYRLFPQIENT